MAASRLSGGVFGLQAFLEGLHLVLQGDRLHALVALPRGRVLGTISAPVGQTPVLATLAAVAHVPTLSVQKAMLYC
jgi:hypothetical protein